MPIESLPDLETFVAIVDSGSFTAAARRQGLTVNAVSRRLQQLEESLGTKLIERTTRRSTPTDAGKRLHQKAAAVFDALLEAEAEVQQSKVAIEGLVRVAIPPALVTRAAQGARARARGMALRRAARVSHYNNRTARTA
jgi:DNA-binding transcriptional LysR family regulator